MAQSRVFYDLDMNQLKRLVLSLTKTLDAEIGKGEASEKLITHMSRSTHKFLVEETHQWTHTLFASYEVLKGETATRGFYDPGGLVHQIIVAKDAVNPVGDKPAQYASVEFDRGGTHDTFDWVSTQFDGYFDDGMELFESELGKKLGF